MDTLIAIILMVAYAVIGFIEMILIFIIPLAAISLIIFLIDLFRK